MLSAHLQAHELKRSAQSADLAAMVFSEPVTTIITLMPTANALECSSKSGISLKLKVQCNGAD